MKFTDSDRIEYEDARDTINLRDMYERRGLDGIIEYLIDIEDDKIVEEALIDHYHRYAALKLRDLLNVLKRSEFK